MNAASASTGSVTVRLVTPGDFQQGPKLPADPSALFGKPPANPKKLHLGRGIAQKYQHNLYSQHKAIAMTSGLPEWRQCKSGI